MIMEEYVNKPKLNEQGACHCIGPENCENDNCCLVRQFKAKLKENNDE